MHSASKPPPRRKATAAFSVELASVGDAKADIRQSLLRAALELLQTKGYTALTQAHVAELAGLRQSHLTYYFPTRNDLLKGVVEATTNSLVVLMNNQGQPTLTKIKSVMVEIASQHSMPRLMLSLIMAAEEDPSLKIWLHAFNQGVIDRLAAVLSQVGLKVAKDNLHLYHSAMVGALVMGLSGTAADTAAKTAKTVRMAFEKLVLESSTPMPVRRKVRRP